MIGGVSVSRRFFVIAVLVAMVISLLMPVRLENDKGGVMSIMNMSFSADGEGNARMKGIVTLDGVNKNFEMRGKLDGVLGNYSGALMGNVNGEPAAMYVFYNQSLKYASLAIGAVNENTQPDIYTFGECTDEMYNDIVKRQVRNVAVSLAGVDKIWYDTENLENCQYRGTYSNAGMKIEMFTPVKMDRVSDNGFMSFVCFEESGLAEYTESRGINLVEHSSRVNYLATGMHVDTPDSGFSISIADYYPDTKDSLHITEEEINEWFMEFENEEIAHAEYMDRISAWKMGNESSKIKTSGEVFRARYSRLKFDTEITEGTVWYPAVMLVSFLGEDEPYAFLLQSSDNANCTIELVTE